MFAFEKPNRLRLRIFKRVIPPPDDSSESEDAGYVAPGIGKADNNFRRNLRENAKDIQIDGKVWGKKQHEQRGQII